MIDHISGNISALTPSKITVSVCFAPFNFIGYGIRIGVRTFEFFNGSDTALVFTHPVITETSHTLYGFHHADERDFFVLLLSVAGVGASTALALLSVMSADVLSAAIAGGREDLLVSVKGIGKKTAQQIVLDLSGKVSSDVSFTDTPAVDSTLRQEAVSALVAVGYSRKEADSRVGAILSANPGQQDVAVIIRESLKK